MVEQVKPNLEELVERVLKATEISEADFKEKGSSSAHNKILDALQEEWNKQNPVLEERAFQIDFVGRSFARQGKILLAVEVDTWFKPIGNWVKLLDINAKCKIWVYLCREKNRATIHLGDAIKEFRKLAKLRKETEGNNVTIYLKVAGKKEVVKRCLFD